MLAKKFRLSHYEFLLVKKTGKQWRNNSLTLIVAPNTLGYSRFAIVTSSKLNKGAVVRNKLRRNLYDYFGKLSLGANDFLIFPRSDMLNLTNEELGSKIDSLLSTLPKFS